MGAAVALTGIKKSYCSNHVLRGVNLVLEAGHFYALIGRNGAGKSTLMRVLTRREPVDSGAGVVMGESIEADSDSFNAQVSYVSEAIGYPIAMSLKDLFAAYPSFHPGWDFARFNELMRGLGLEDSKQFEQLSRGQKMQVAICAALAGKPKLLVLDEVTSVLDARAREFLMSYLSDFVRNGGTVVMATNIVSEVRNVADHLVLLQDGVVQFSEPVQKVANKFVRLKARARQEHAILSNAECIECGRFQDGSLLFIAPLELAGGLEVPEDLRDSSGPVTPEEAFIYFSKREGS